MATLQTFGIIIFLGVLLFILGKQYMNYPLGIIGGFTVFASGIMMLLIPIVNIDPTTNTVLGSILFGVGAYLWVTPAIEAIKGDETNSEGEW